jgi:hypothetical protein
MNCRCHDPVVFGHKPSCGQPRDALGRFLRRSRPAAKAPKPQVLKPQLFPRAPRPPQPRDTSGRFYANGMHNF